MKAKQVSLLEIITGFGKQILRYDSPKPENFYMKSR